MNMNPVTDEVVILLETESFYDNIINVYANQKDRSINLTYKT